MLEQYLGLHNHWLIQSESYVAGLQIPQIHMLPVSDTPIQHVTFVPNMHNTGRETFCALGNLRSLLVDNDEKL